MFGEYGTLFDVRGEDPEKFVVEVAHHVYRKKMCNKLILKKRLYSLRIQEGGDVLGHIQKFK